MNSEKWAKLKRRWRRRMVVLAWILAVLVAARCIYGGVMWLRFRAEVSRIREAGYSVTLDELDAWYSIPPGEANAADIYTEAFSKLTVFTQDSEIPVVGAAPMPEPDAPFSKEMLAVMAMYVAVQKGSLALLHKAAEVEKCRYPLDLKGGIPAQPDYALSDSARRAGRTLAVEALLHVEKKRPDDAIRSIRASFALARSLSQVPTLISSLVAASLESYSRLPLPRMLTRLELTDAQLTELTAMCEDAERIDATTRAFVSERCFGLALFETHVQWELAMLRHVYALSGLLADDRSYYLFAMGRHVTATELPLAERKDAWRRLADEFDIPRRPGASWDWPFPFRFISSRFTRSLSGVISTDLQRRAGLRTARTALALERFRLKHGKLPDALSELVPGFLKSVPFDPFDGKPLRYKKLEKGHMVWSIGEDGTDHDGGVREDPETAMPGRDIVFTVKR